jgi:two-component system, NtrC family, nitrogen regulation sensor histidine kinase NtrY
MARRGWIAPRYGTVAAALALVAGALWLRSPSVPYLAGCLIATAGAALGLPARRQSGWARSVAAIAALLVFCILAAGDQYRLHRVDNSWPALREELRVEGARRARVAIEEDGRRLTDIAAAALDAPPEPEEAFRALQPVAAGSSERGVVVYRDGQPLAWAGVIRVLTASSGSPVDAVFTPMYVALRASAERGNRRSLAVSLIHAAPPANRLSRPLDALLERRYNVQEFVYGLPADSSAGELVTVAGVPVMRIAVGDLNQAAVRLQTLESVRVRTGVVLAAALALLVAAAWRPTLRLRDQATVIAIALGALAVVPLSAFSNATRLFDPLVYFAPLGGPFTASAGALAITSSLLLLLILSMQRGRVRLPRTVALVLLLLFVSLGPFLLRDLARGISAPPWGVSLMLWTAWQGTLFLAAMVVLVGTVTIGRTLVTHTRGITPAISVMLALVAGALGPILWRAPSGWPEWYAALWAAAIGTLALTRRTRLFLVAATLVAGTGAATLVWGSTARRRVELATRDVAGLVAPDPYALSLTNRLAAQIDAGPQPRTRLDLLRTLASSDVVSGGYPVHLAIWDPTDTVRAVLAPAPFAEQWDSLAVLVEGARTMDQPLIGQASGVPGVHVLLAVPHPDGAVTTAAIAPRTRLIPDPPFGALLGVHSPGSAEPPYGITLADAHPEDLELPPEGRWTRSGNELHGDWIVRTPDGIARAHVEVNLRSLGALVQRGTLLLLLNLLMVAILWGLTLTSGGGAIRWIRARRGEWLHSYRARLTLALFAFFIVPAGAFALWSWQRLVADDVQSRVLLVGETLRAAAAAGEPALLPDIAANFDTPLLLFSGGELAFVSDELYRDVAPVGRFLPPDVMLDLGIADEITAARSFMVGRDRVVFGYRSTQAPSGDRHVIAAPARARELVLENRRRDLAILVAFATALGALAALWLSGVAARELASPIGALRHAALELAAGRHSSDLAQAPPSEFQPVFSAFRQMARDLDASRQALEAAERRISAVLRDVASGVVAVDRLGEVSLANPAAAALLVRELHPGMSIDDAGSGELASSVRRFLESGSAEEEFDVETGGRQLHGRLTRLERGSGGAVITLDDVTELARAQRVLAWGEMARQVAHEIKNPLTPIRLGVQHLRRARSDSRVDFDKVLDTNVDRILEEIDRLDEIARAFSRYGLAPDQRPSAKPTDVAGVARDTVALEQLGPASVDWQLEGADSPALALANSEELREVLLNLLENARLASARVVHVRVRKSSDGSQVLLTVEDDGEGIPPDVLPRIFEPHFSTRTSGSGLGLAITRRMVEGWGGSIVVSSEPGRGTTVTVALAAADDGSDHSSSHGD